MTRNVWRLPCKLQGKAPGCLHVAARSAMRVRGHGLQASSMRNAWSLTNQLPTETKYESKAWVLSGIGSAARVNYSMQARLSTHCAARLVSIAHHTCPACAASSHAGRHHPTQAGRHTHVCIDCAQVMVAEAYLDNTRCYNLTDVSVSFLDNGMDSTGQCSPENGGCTFTYTYVDGLNLTDRGVQYGPFLAGKPNLASVSPLTLSGTMPCRVWG